MQLTIKKPRSRLLKPQANYMAISLKDSLEIQSPVDAVQVTDGNCFCALENIQGPRRLASIHMQALQ